MVQYIPPPDPRTLIPPLLACLPTAFASPRPPPALSLLLSPILRQRIDLMTSSSRDSDSWLGLLCWDKAQAVKLIDSVSESESFEPHPVSGEIEYGEIESPMYRRLDEETLQARFHLSEVRLLIIYSWCHAGEGSHMWGVSEVLPVGSETEDASENWYSSIPEAERASRAQGIDDAIRQGEAQSLPPRDSDGTPIAEEMDEEDDGDYWAQYDKTPGARTPAASKAHASMGGGRARATSEDEYFARYENVQPEMDNDDPTTGGRPDGKLSAEDKSSTSMVDHGQDLTNRDQLRPSSDITKLSRFDIDLTDMNQPAATSLPADARQVQRLEDSADSQSLAEMAIKQHVSTSIKSMFRLCRSSGIGLADFAQMMQTELAALSMMEDEV